MTQIEIQIPDGWEVVVDSGKIILRPKQQAAPQFTPWPWGPWIIPTWPVYPTITPTYPDEPIPWTLPQTWCCNTDAPFSFSPTIVEC